MGSGVSWQGPYASGEPGGGLPTEPPLGSGGPDAGPEAPFDAEEHWP